MINLAPYTTVPVLSDELFQEWPTFVQTIFTVNLITGLVPLQTINFSIKDVIGTDLYLAYSDFRLRTYQAYDNPTIEFITPTSIEDVDYSNNPATTVSLTTTNINYNFTPVFQNIALLNYGNHIFKSFFEIEGLNAAGIWVKISEYTHTLKLIKFNSVSPTATTFSPSNLFFNYALGVLTPIQEIVLTGTWEFIVPQFIILTTSDTGVVFENSASGTKASGVGNKTINFGLDTSYFNSLAVSSIPYIFTTSIINPVTPTIIGELQILVAISEPGVASITPDVFEFSAIKYIQEPTPQFGFISGITDFDIEAPAWLIVSTGEFYIEDILIGNIQLVPLPTSSMEPATYSETLKIIYDFEGDETILEIPIIYALTGLLTSPYSGNGFTLDNEFFQFASEFPDTYFEITSTIKTPKRFQPTLNETIILDKLSLFKGKGKLNLGKRIHQLMPKLIETNTQEFQFIPGELSMEIIEKNISDNVTLRSISSDVIKFIPGISYTLLNNSATFLDINLSMQRVTQEGKYKLNVLLPQGAYIIELYKQSTLVEAISLVAFFHGVYSKEINFSNFFKGDTVKAILKSAYSPTVLSEKFFKVYPNNMYSNLIHWENDYLTESIFEFTAEYKMLTDFEYTSQTLFAMLTEVLENSSSKTINKFTINTGWIRKTDHTTLNTLLRARKVWLKKDDEFISITPITKSLPSIDSQRFINGFDLEFQINKKYNEKNYTF